MEPNRLAPPLGDLRFHAAVRDVPSDWFTTGGMVDNRTLASTGGRRTQLSAPVVADAEADAVIDLVGDEPHAALAAPARNGGELGGRQHRAGGVGRAGDDQPV